jgi:hypothetical protein
MIANPQQTAPTISDRYVDFLCMYVVRPLRAEAGEVLKELLVDMRREGAEMVMAELEAIRDA